MNWEMKRITVLILLLVGLATGGARADGIGVVLVHGKQGTADQPQLAYLSQQIEKAGFAVDHPTMCWTPSRLYDRTLSDCLADIDASIARLRLRGMTSFVVAGHSLGGLGAVLYGATHDGLKGIVALAPAPGPRVAGNPAVVPSIKRAQALIAAGQGDEVQSFADNNTGPSGFFVIQVHATPKIFMSFFDMSGPANLVTDASQLKAPVLWVSGTKDQSQIARELGFDKAPAHPLNRYLQVNAGHMDTPEAATDAVVAWLKDVAKN